MATRIMSKVSGRERPLSFDSRGTTTPWLAGSSTSWAGLPIEAHRIRSFETQAEAGPLDGECGLLVITEGRLDVAARHDGRDVRGVVAAGTTLLVSGDDRATRVRMTGQADAVAVHLPAEWFQRLSIDEVPAGFGRSRRFIGDSTVLSLVVAMRDEVARGAPTGRVFAESLSLALLSYVVHQNAPRASGRVRGRLSEAECHRLRCYVLDRLGEDLSVTDLAMQVGRRPRHFSTLFRQAFGEPPHQFLLRHRLTEGARMLASGRFDVAGVAFRMGFCSQSHFTAAFRRAFGVSPARYAGEKRARAAVS
jgi:AraC family transcriptional regulator